MIHKKDYLFIKFRVYNAENYDWICPQGDIDKDMFE